MMLSAYGTTVGKCIINTTETAVRPLTTSVSVYDTVQSFIHENRNEQQDKWQYVFWIVQILLLQNYIN